MEDFSDLGGDRGRAMRQAATLAKLRAVDASAADRLVSSVQAEPDPGRINLGLLRAFFERRAAARAARVGKRVEAVFRAFYRLPVRLRPKAMKLLLAGAKQPARRSFLGRLFRRRAA